MNQRTEKYVYDASHRAVERFADADERESMIMCDVEQRIKEARRKLADASVTTALSFAESAHPEHAVPQKACNDRVCGVKIPGLTLELSQIVSESKQRYDSFTAISACVPVAEKDERQLSDAALKAQFEIKECAALQKADLCDAPNAVFTSKRTI